MLMGMVVVAEIASVMLMGMVVVAEIASVMCDVNGNGSGG